MQEDNKEYTIQDIARLAGVSASSVSRVINEIPGVNPTKRKLILKIIKDTGYYPNSLASALVKGKTNIVGLILGDIRNPFYAYLTNCVQKSLQEKGYIVMLFNSEYNGLMESECLSVAKRLGFAGIIMITAMNDKNLLDNINSLSCPVVLLNRTVKNFEGSAVVLDNFQAGYIAAMHLIDLGHSKIAFVSGPESSSSSESRLLGFRQAMQNCALPVNEDYIFEGDLTYEYGYDFADTYTSKLSKLPAAVICGNDLMAIGFLNRCAEKGIRVPEDISIMGFDDIFISDFAKINLTTITQPITKMGSQAVKLLLEKIQNPGRKGKQIVYKPELIKRGTTGPYHGQANF